MPAIWALAAVVAAPVPSALAGWRAAAALELLLVLAAGELAVVALAAVVVAAVPPVPGVLAPWRALLVVALADAALDGDAAGALDEAVLVPPDGLPADVETLVEVAGLPPLLTLWVVGLLVAAVSVDAEAAGAALPVVGLDPAAAVCTELVVDPVVPAAVLAEPVVDAVVDSVALTWLVDVVVVGALGAEPVEFVGPAWLVVLGEELEDAPAWLGLATPAVVVAASAEAENALEVGREEPVVEPAAPLVSVSAHAVPEQPKSAARTPRLPTRTQWRNRLILITTSSVIDRPLWPIDLRQEPCQPSDKRFVTQESEAEDARMAGAPASPAGLVYSCSETGPVDFMGSWVYHGL